MCIESLLFVCQESLLPYSCIRGVNLRNEIPVSKINMGRVTHFSQLMPVQVEQNLRKFGSFPRKYQKLEVQAKRVLF